MREHEQEIYAPTAAEQLARWDEGRPIWSLEMGGLGPGYEQCIQVACMEVVRDLLNVPMPVDGDVPGWKAWYSLADAALDRANEFPGMGMSGAQAGAAKSLAAQFLKHGPKAFFEVFIPEHAPDRAEDKILVSRNWPQPPAPAAGQPK